MNNTIFGKIGTYFGITAKSAKSVMKTAETQTTLCELKPFDLPYEKPLQISNLPRTDKDFRVKLQEVQNELDGVKFYLHTDGQNMSKDEFEALKDQMKMLRKEERGILARLDLPLVDKNKNDFNTLF